MLSENFTACFSINNRSDELRLMKVAVNKVVLKHVGVMTLDGLYAAAETCCYEYRFELLHE